MNDVIKTPNQLLTPFERLFLEKAGADLSGEAPRWERSWSRSAEDILQAHREATAELLEQMIATQKAQEVLQ